jgi:hypothetical protein
MELLFIIPVLTFAAIYAAYREWLHRARRRLARELDLLRRRVSIYEELKGAVQPLCEEGSVSRSDVDRFARALAEIRPPLFDADLESFVGSLYRALLKKCALDALLIKAAAHAQSAEDRVLTEMGRRKSLELGSQITEGIYQDMPKRLQKFMPPRLPA